MTDVHKTSARRLAALRKEMATFGADGFIVPRSDEHQGEYVAPCSERLHWLTGFSGSAGYAIILKDKAALFVDGRYTLQATQECDANLYDFRHVSEEPATDWLEEVLAPGAILTYDPWLHTGAGLHRLKELAERKGFKLKAAEHNFIDAIWAKRPGPPMDVVRVHDLEYAGQPFEDKLDHLAQKLKEAGVGASVLSQPDSIAWLLNIRGSDIPCTPVALAFAIVHDTGKADLFIHPAKITDDVKAHFKDRVTVQSPESFAKHLGRLKSVHFDSTTTPVWVHKRLKKAKAEIKPGDDFCALPKACKNPVELDGMRNAHKRDGAALVDFLCWLSTRSSYGDVNEWNVAEKLDGLRAQNELFVDYSFPTISGFGPNGAIVHYRVKKETARPFEEGSLYLVDSGAQYHDGTTDVTRTIAIGSPTDEMKARFTSVLKGHIALSSARFPKGTTGSQLDVLARHALWQEGLDYDHGTGHGVGSFLSVHEGPQRISKMASKIALEPGMVISNEPGYYKTDGYGIRIENLICVVQSPKGDGDERDMLAFEPLTLCPIDRSLIDASRLSPAEIDWINAYHDKVFKTLKGTACNETTKWLLKACSPL